MGSVILYLKSESDEVKIVVRESDIGENLEDFLRSVFEHDDIKEMLQPGEYEVHAIVEEWEEGRKDEESEAFDNTG